MLNIKRPEPITHLYRGAPIVRSWSKYQKTDTNWTLCGIPERDRKIRELRATDVAETVSCAFCLQLMQNSPTATTKSGHPSSTAA